MCQLCLDPAWKGTPKFHKVAGAIGRGSQVGNNHVVYLQVEFIAIAYGRAGPKDDSIVGLIHAARFGSNIDAVGCTPGK